jgi:hypothetical protein
MFEPVPLPVPVADLYAAPDWRLQIKANDTDDAIVRILGILQVQGARITGLGLKRLPRELVLCVEGRALGQSRLQHLQARLEALPIVNGVLCEVE